MPAKACHLKTKALSGMKMQYFYYLFGTMLGAWFLWVFYVCIMRLKMVQDNAALTKGQKVFAYPTLVVGFVLDVVFNLIVCTLLFLEIPREWTVSARLWRHSNVEKDSWRKRVALAIRVELLDSIDPRGVHSATL